MHISGLFNENQKANIDDKKANIQNKLSNIDGLNSKTVSHILSLYNELDVGEIFGRTVVERVTGLKPTRASELLKLLLDHNIIVPVQGYGKGKYRFL